LGVINQLANLQNANNNQQNDSQTNYAMMRIARWKLNGFKNLEVKKTPLIDLPLGATEDRICGTINLERAVTSGKRGFEPGLLANTHRGLLYVDEVNLLDDHLVDILLDAAASGSTIVEREGVSVKHPSKFILIGSGNPEEGEIRPQLLDRFQFQSNIIAFNFAKELNRPYVPDGMDILRYTVLAGCTVSIAFYYEQKMLKKYFYKDMRDNKMIF
jgi:Mg-chelatase subunit ChlI